MGQAAASPMLLGKAKRRRLRAKAGKAPDWPLAADLPLHGWMDVEGLSTA